MAAVSPVTLDFSDNLLHRVSVLAASMLALPCLLLLTLSDSVGIIVSGRLGLLVLFF